MKLGFKADAAAESSLAGSSGISLDQEQSLTDYERRLLKSPYAQPASFDHVRGKKRREKERLLINAVRHLPHEKKVDLLQSLSKLEDELKTPSVVVGHGHGHGHGGGSVGGGSSVGRYNGGSVVGDDLGSFGSFDDASMTVSVMSMSSGFVEKNYGIVTESPVKIMQRTVIRSLCKVGKAIEASDLKHMVGSRDMTEIVGLTALREFLHSRLKCSLTTKEAELIMKFIDTNNRGEVNIYDVLGMAQLNYDKLRRQLKKKRDKEIVGAERKELLIRRKNYIAKCEEEKLKGEDSLGRVLEVLGEGSYKLMVARTMSALQHPRRLVLNSTLFQELLLDCGVNLTLRERKLLELRYSSLHPPRMGSVDYTAFKAEFVALGAELIVARRKHESMDRFLQALQGMGISSPAMVETAINGQASASASGGGSDAGPATVGSPSSDPPTKLPSAKDTTKVSLSQVLSSAKPSLGVKPVHGKKRKVPKGGKLEPIKAIETWPEETRPPETDDGDELPADEEFPGHPDIVTSVTKTRNTELRRSFAGNTRRSFENGVAGNYEMSAHIRRAVDDMLDPSKIGEEILMLNPKESGSLQNSRRDDESQDMVMPLAAVDEKRRRSRRTLERPPLGPPTLSPIGAGKKPSLFTDTSARVVRRNSHRRVSELIRDAQKPGAPATNNMAANLTEQAHAFTSSVAIMNMINYSTELMVMELTKANSANIGLSSDFSRRFSVAKSPTSSGKLTKSNSSGGMQGSPLGSARSFHIPSVTDVEEEGDEAESAESTPVSSRRSSLSNSRNHSQNSRGSSQQQPWSRKSSLMSPGFDAAASKEARTLIESVLRTGSLTAGGRRDSAMMLLKTDVAKFHHVAAVATALVEHESGGDMDAAQRGSNSSRHAGGGVVNALSYVSDKSERAAPDADHDDEPAASAVASMMTRMAFDDLSQGDTTVTLNKLRLWSYVQELCTQGLLTTQDFDDLFHAAMAADEAAKPLSMSISGKQRECITFTGFLRILEDLAALKKGSAPLDESVLSVDGATAGGNDDDDDGAVARLADESVASAADGGGQGADEDAIEDLVGNNSKNPSLQ